MKAFLSFLGLGCAVLLMVALSAPTSTNPTWLQANSALLIVVGLVVVVLFVVLAIVRSSNNTIQQISYHNSQTTQQAFRTVEALSTSQQTVLLKALQLGWELRGQTLLPPPNVDEKPLLLKPVEAEYVRDIT